MNSREILEVVAIYRQVFENSAIPKIDFPHDQFLVPRYGDDALSHCHGMLDKIETFATQGMLEESFGCLSFVQGVLWSMGAYSLEDLKIHNRPSSAK